MKDTKKNANEARKRVGKGSLGQRKKSVKEMYVLKHQALQLPPKKKSEANRDYGFVVL